MYERFTDQARKVMQLANQEAQRFNHEYIGTEHILLGIIKVDGSRATSLITMQGGTLKAIRLEVEKLVQSGPDMVTMGRLPQTPRAKMAIEAAMQVSRQLNQNYIGTEHILLGLMKEPDGVAHQVLQRFELTFERTREKFIEMLQQEGDPKAIEFMRISESLSSQEQAFGVAVLGLLRRSGCTRQQTWKIAAELSKPLFASTLANILLTAKPEPDGASETDLEMARKFGRILPLVLDAAKRSETDVVPLVDKVTAFFSHAEVGPKGLQAAMLLLEQ